METEIIYSSPSAILWFHSEGKIIHHKILKQIYTEEFSIVMNLGTQTLKEKSANKWLSEDPPNVPLEKQRIDSGMREWFPKTLEAGWKYWAIIKPKTALAQLSKEKIVKNYSKMGIETKYFEDPEKALEWLRSIPDE